MVGVFDTFSESRRRCYYRFIEQVKVGLHCSYRGSDLKDVARLLLQKEIDVNAKTNNGYNTLHLLCTSYKGNDMLDIVQLLIENGVDFNGRNVNGKKARDYFKFHFHFKLPGSPQKRNQEPIGVISNFYSFHLFVSFLIL